MLVEYACQVLSTKPVLLLPCFAPFDIKTVFLPKMPSRRIKRESARERERGGRERGRERGEREGEREGGRERLYFRTREKNLFI